VTYIHLAGFAIKREVIRLNWASEGPCNRIVSDFCAYRFSLAAVDGTQPKGHSTGINVNAHVHSIIRRETVLVTKYICRISTSSGNRRAKNY
jgi:hypothetical protein